MRDGRTIKISDMTDLHLYRVIKMIRKMARKTIWFSKGLGPDWHHDCPEPLIGIPPEDFTPRYSALMEEAKRRGLSLSQAPAANPNQDAINDFREKQL